MAIFVLAQLLMGAGISPFYPLVPAYLDENVHPKHMPVYLGIWTCTTFLGPGLGMILGGKFLSIYVDLEQVRYNFIVCWKTVGYCETRSSPISCRYKTDIGLRNRRMFNVPVSVCKTDKLKNSFIFSNSSRKTF
jgi:MFS family permease